MSYPDPRYLGDRGKVNATFRRSDHEPELRIGAGTAMSYLATGGSTHGKFGLYRVDMQPRAPGARAHFHRTISESFFNLSGTIRLFNGERWIDSTAGDFLHVPEGGVHAFHNESDERASMLLLFAPGVPREGYFEALAEIAAGRKFSDAEWREICRRHDSYFL
jgi:quercetin dioxygenase-like cupin family protein